MSGRRALFLIDGEHYPPVVLEAMERVCSSLGVEPVAAVLLGGTEKIGEGTDYGMPLVFGEDPEDAVREAIVRYEVDVVVDLSDEPVVGYRERMRIASRVLAAGARYVGSDFELRPPEFQPVFGKPSLAVIGTGKRIGKTAVTGYLARLLAREGFDPIVVSMGRGGPPRPEVIDGKRMEIGSDYLLEALRRGAHAASDCYETAALSRVTTVGCRRCGGGLAGAPFVSNVIEGARVAAGLEGGLILFDGSGAALPPVEAGARVLVAGANQDPEYVTGFLGAYRLLVSEVLLITMAEEPLASPERVQRLRQEVRRVKPEIEVVPVVFRPRPAMDVRGVRLVYVSTAPRKMLGRLAGFLEENYGCRVVAATGNLSNRRALERDLEDVRGAEAYLTEIKAAAVDVVVRRGLEEGVPVYYCDNEPVAEGLDRVLLDAAGRALRRFTGKKSG
ncbi:MAG: 2,3-diphosphoglycerate synthetase [Rubrobacteraceae bacterium]|nr:2,3-diphosphoglycerate synthetase [Rubrobacteraceae bacterium]